MYRNANQIARQKESMVSFLKFKHCYVHVNLLIFSFNVQVGEWVLQSAAFGVDTVQISRSADLLLLSNLLHVHVYFISTSIKDFLKYHRTAASVINTQRK